MLYDGKGTRVVQPTVNPLGTGIVDAEDTPDWSASRECAAGHWGSQ